MASINRVILSGNLTQDPVLRKTPNGVSVCTMRLAVSEYFKTAGGEQQERTLFIDVVAWERQAENCAKFLAKASSIIVDGRLRQEEYKNANGENRTKVSVMAQNVQFLSSPNRDPQTPAGYAPKSRTEKAADINEITDDGNDDKNDDDEEVPF